MRKFLTLFTISVHIFFTALAKPAFLRVTVAGSKSIKSWLYLPSQPGQSIVNLVYDDNNTATHTFTLTRPVFMQLYCFNPDDYGREHFFYLLYLSPGDSLQFNADIHATGYALKVSGNGYQNNQPLLAGNEYADFSEFNQDTLPYRVISAINMAQKTRRAKLEEYIKLYKPSETYVADWKLNLDYYACDAFYEFKENNKYNMEDAYARNHLAWQKITDSLFSTVKLNNDVALTAFRYQLLGRWFLIREREHFADSASRNLDGFYKKWYNTDTIEGRKQFDADSKNEVLEKLINQYFAGKTAEYLYAVLLSEAMETSNPQNIPAIFKRFIIKYPNSGYVSRFNKFVNTIVEKQKRMLTDKMVFLTGGSKNYNSLEDVIAAMKGKTVLVDMWGTWCGPCREEIEKNSEPLKGHFKDRKLDYLYVANYDTNNEAKWKKMVAYFNIEGMHLLASQQLTDDIMAKVKGQGFPTIFIIKKDGSFELSKSAYPIQLDILIKQLEGDLLE